MTDTGTGLKSGVKEIATAGTAEALTTTVFARPFRSVVVSALSTNEAPVVVGDTNVKAKVGAHGSTEQRGISLPAGASLSLDIDDPGKVFVDVTKNKDAVSWIALEA